MTLSEIITKLTKQNSDGKKLFTQDTLAVRLGLDPRKGQQQLSKMKSGGEVWELHWRMFLRLLPVCIEHEILSPHDLKELWETVLKQEALRSRERQRKLF